jgi:hypothetical protein
MHAQRHATSSACMCVAHLGTRPFLSAGDNASGLAENAVETRTHSLAGVGGLNERWNESSRRPVCRGTGVSEQSRRRTTCSDTGQRSNTRERVDLGARMTVFGCGAIWGEFERYVRWCQAAVKSKSESMAVNYLRDHPPY